jgi:hypothetical protein
VNLLLLMGSMIDLRLITATYQRLHRMALRMRAEVISGARAVTGKLTTLRGLLLDQTANDQERGKLDPIFDAHLAPRVEDMIRYAIGQKVSMVGA